MVWLSSAVLFSSVPVELMLGSPPVTTASCERGTSGRVELDTSEAKLHRVPTAAVRTVSMHSTFSTDTSFVICTRETKRGGRKEQRYC